MHNLTRYWIRVSFAVFLAAVPAVARAQGAAPPVGEDSTKAAAPSTGVQPPSPPPKDMPPPPSAQTPPPPQAQPIEPPRAAPTPLPAAPIATPPAGQWVYTVQYGWLWMPYERGYTYVMPDAALAYSYVYYPTFGWRWVIAPWVLGFGVSPYWGPPGPSHYVWYARPWFRVGVPYYPYRGPGWRPPPRVRGAPPPRHR